MSRRLLAELCLVLVVGGLVAGVVIGSGLSVTKVDVPNVLTWLSTRHGDVVQVNPYRGTQDRLKIGQPGDTLQVVQNGKQLIVYDTTTGKMTFIDLTTLTMSGQRQGPAGEGGLKVLLGDAIFVADPKSGTVVALDPLTASTVAAWQSPGALADVAISGAGDRLFAIDAHGTETTLGYSGTAFAVQGKREIAGAGGHAVLVGNPSGFTVLDGGSHLVGQFDTGSQDRTGVVPAVDDPVLAPVTSSSTLVGATSTTSDSLVLVREDRDVTVSLAGSGCMPERPAVYQSKVYLHCRGANKVLVFDRDGRQVGPIPSPTGASEMVDNGDMLFINFPGDDSAVVVDQNGAVRQLSTDAPSVPARDLNAAPTTVPSQGDRGANRGPQPPQATHRQPTNPSNGGQGTNAPRHSPRTNASANGTPSADPSGTADPTTTPSPVSSPVPSGGTLSDGPTAEPPSPTQPSPTKASPPPDPATYTPTGVVAQAIDNSWIQLTWTPPPAGAPQLYRYLDAATGAELGSTAAPGGQNSATITTVPPGTTLSIVVEATYP
ncbi:MAG: fibronectin type III domain-containing protein, partial [Micromonosporaceae bacterium]|nr:fibronectin type III domain-containing protein [Micromonosporaceae bacterium]